MKSVRITRGGTIVAGCMAALMITAAGALADDDRRVADEWPGCGTGYGMHSGWGGGMGRGAAMRFHMIDQNDNGVISDDEAAASAEAVFIAMDADDSGDITEAEFLAVRMGPGYGRNPARQATMQERKKARFPQMDTDKSKTVSQAEFLAAAQKRFAAADANKDGRVTPWEFRTKRRVF